MKNLLVWGAALLALTSLSAAPSRAQASAAEVPPHGSQATLENSDILDMLKAGLPEEVILAKVQGCPCNFDTSPASLAALKSAQVPNGVILAMVKRFSPTNTSEDRDPPPSSFRPASEPAKASVSQFRAPLVRDAGKTINLGKLVLGDAMLTWTEEGDPTYNFSINCNEVRDLKKLWNKPASWSLEANELCMIALELDVPKGKYRFFAPLGMSATLTTRAIALACGDLAKA